MRYVIPILALILFVSGCGGKGRSLFPGLWHLHIIETQDSVSGKWVESEWMKGGLGYLHYDQYGTMSIHFVPAGFRQSNPQDLPLDSLSEEALKMLASDYWYMGKYRILEDEKEVEHQRIIHSDPGEWGKIVRRSYLFKGDTLILSAPEFGLRLKWLRSKARPKDPESHKG